MADTTDRPNRRYLDDFATGQRFESGPLTLSADAIMAFARSFDPQPFHTDPEAARDTLFAGLAASGWHTAAVTMRLLVDSGFGDIAGGMIGRGIEGLGWPRPVRPGDTLRVFSEIVEVRRSASRPDRGTVRMKSETRNQNGEIVQEMTATLMVPAR
jgi:acyl dehydratase